MKTNILITLALIMGMMLAGCSKEEGDKFMIDMKQISILVGDDYKIMPSGTFTARSTDEDVATVSSTGVVHGVSAGEADIIFTPYDGGQAQTCKVSVAWKYNYFDEPILDFSMNLEQLKAMEVHKYESDNEWEPGSYIQNATNPWLARFNYDNQSILMKICYGILDKENGGIGEIVMTAPSFRNFTQSQKEEIIQQLTERYGAPVETKDDLLFSPQKKSYTVMIRNRLNITYRPK